MKKRLLSLLLLSQFAFGSYTEKDALFDALSYDESLLATGITIQKDSLNVVQVKTALLPQISLVGSQTITPYDTTKYTIVGADFSKSEPRAVTLANAKVSQHLKGGGRLSAEAGFRHQDFLGRDSTEQQGDLTLEYNQPLLRGAWRDDRVAYQIKIAQIAQKSSQEQIKGRVIREMTAIRKVYWEGAIFSSFLKLLQIQQSRNEAIHQKEVIRFGLGENRALDTLNSRLALLQSRQALSRKEFDGELVIKKLQNRVGVTELTLDSFVSVSDDMRLPSKEQIIKTVLSSSSEASLFQQIEERLSLRIDNEKNTLLPQLDFSTTFRKSVSGSTIFSEDRRDHQDLTFGLRATYNLPIRRIKQEILQQKLAIEENELNREAFEKRVSYQADRLTILWEQEKRDLALLKESVTVAKMRLQLATEAYDHGGMSSFDLKRVEEDWLKESIHYYQQVFALKQIEISVDEMTETVLDKFGVVIE